jgi:hypothetical protein
MNRQEFWLGGEWRSQAKILVGGMSASGKSPSFNPDLDYGELIMMTKITRMLKLEKVYLLVTVRNQHNPS